MGWIHDTGYDSAYDHEGWAASVLTDGTDTGTWSAEIAPRVVGWRAACACGWRGNQFYPRAEWPSKTGFTPDDVDGWENDTGCYAEWDAHLRETLPALAIHDLTQQIAKAQDELIEAVRRARSAGVSWTTIGDAADITRQSAHERWSDLAS
jgi:hypothetical protein